MTMTDQQPSWGIVPCDPEYASYGIKSQAAIDYATGIKPVVRVAIHCTGTRKNGQMCNEVLCKVDLSRWEQVCTDAREDVCDQCGKRYTLADYR